MITIQDLNIKSHPLKEGQYIKSETQKKQIYLHHTVGGPSGERTIDIWNNDRAKVGTAICISRNGDIVQAFSSKYWAFHLGLKESAFESKGVPYISLDKISIGIELCSYGPLTLDKGRYKTVYGQFLSDDEVVRLEEPYRGAQFWHKYTPEQIESVRKLLLFWSQRYNIPVTYNEDVWDVTTRALIGQPGVYTHNSVRYDKADIYPDPDLIKMWKGLDGI